jgi:hypothetical protein
MVGTIGLKYLAKCRHQADLTGILPRTLNIHKVAIAIFAKSSGLARATVYEARGHPHSAPNFLIGMHREVFPTEQS